MALIPTGERINNAKALSNFQLDNKLKKLIGETYVGTFDNDSLPRPPPFRPWATIINSRKDTDKRIGHWCAVVVDKRGYGHFFDSYGGEITTPGWKDYLKNISKNGRYTRSTIQIQDYDSNICGHLCISFIVNRLKKPYLTDNQIVRLINVNKAVALYN